MLAANFSTDSVDLPVLNAYYRMWLQHFHKKLSRAVFINDRVKAAEVRL